MRDTAQSIEQSRPTSTGNGLYIRSNHNGQEFRVCDFPRIFLKKFLKEWLAYETLDGT